MFYPSFLFTICILFVTFCFERLHAGTLAQTEVVEILLSSSVQKYGKLHNISILTAGAYYFSNSVCTMELCYQALKLYKKAMFQL